MNVVCPYCRIPAQLEPGLVTCICGNSYVVPGEQPAFVVTNQRQPVRAKRTNERQFLFYFLTIMTGMGFLGAILSVWDGESSIPEALLCAVGVPILMWLLYLLAKALMYCLGHERLVWLVLLLCLACPPLLAVVVPLVCVMGLLGKPCRLFVLIGR